ncbi:spermidine synthase [Streptomyces chitinivorans]|uniref:Spermidine synthase n=1 Tax=Streptomyces chitinivorans TaxID=1257027 RepID=A0ABW7HTQ8_9ACTN|nr:spermidine synthase [Streptomyces chitinivorans]MDH2411952.1 spermidine synthase [Streptomyces chitinivorans]
MSMRFEEIDWRPTPMGDISLRRRRDPVTGREVYEVKLGDEFLMSSLFTTGETELARLGLAALPWDAAGPDVSGLDVAVGGLGLGYTARAVLEDPRVRSLVVVDALPDVIRWHEEKLVPLGEALVSDGRCRLVQGDFFERAAGTEGLDPRRPGGRFHAILLDVDHSPRHVLHPGHAPFYEEAGLRALSEHLHPGGVFALWSDDPPDEEFTPVLGRVFATAEAHVVRFDNPYRPGEESANTVYVAGKAPERSGG